jgi:hypothetical protein
MSLIVKVVMPFLAAEAFKYAKGRELAELLPCRCVEDRLVFGIWM